MWQTNCYVTVHMVNVRIVFVLHVFAVYVCCVCMYACVGMSVLCVCVCVCVCVHVWLSPRLVCIWKGGAIC